MELLNERVLEALEFAAAAHQGQKRKNPHDIPYFSHPAAVALALTKAGFRDEVVIAGALHDVLEDTAKTAEDIRSAFGEEILQLVLGVTENKTLEWDARNRAYNEHLREVSGDVLAISAADLLANRMSLIVEFGKGVNPWLSFSKNPKAYAEKRLAFDRDRIKIIKSRMPGQLVEALERTEQQVIALTEGLAW